METTIRIKISTLLELVDHLGLSNAIEELTNMVYTAGLSDSSVINEMFIIYDGSTADMICIKYGLVRGIVYAEDNNRALDEFIRKNINNGVIKLPNTKKSSDCYEEVAKDIDTGEFNAIDIMFKNASASIKNGNIEEAKDWLDLINTWKDAVNF